VKVSCIVASKKNVLLQKRAGDLNQKHQEHLSVCVTALDEMMKISKMKTELSAKQKNLVKTKKSILIKIPQQERSTRNDNNSQSSFWTAQ